MANEKTSSEAASAPTQAVEKIAEPSLLEQAVARFGKDPATQERGKSMLRVFLDEIVKGHIAISEDREMMIDSRITAIDKVLSDQLNEILHHEAFQKLEGTWRGLKYLVSNSELSPMLKIRILNAKKEELVRDFRTESDFDQGGLFKKIYSDEFDQYGGDPFGAVIGDYEFSKHPQDIKLLGRISQVAAAAHAPFLTAAAPDLLDLESFTKLGDVRDFATVMDTTEYAGWRSFRDSEDSRYVGLCLPHMLLRLPYGADTTPCGAFNYEEGVHGKDHSKYLWGNAAYALGARLTNAFALSGWCAAIRGPEGGGLVEGLPGHTFRTDEGDIALKCPTEVAITERRDKELSDLGFIPLVHCKHTDYAAFFSVQSAQKPKVYNEDAATANARLSSQLQYILAVSRFAHYLKAIGRDKIGGFMSRSQCEAFLNKWIQTYAIANDDAPAATKAKNPLREASVVVEDVKGQPGKYRAIAYLRPHYQLDELSVSLRLVADIPKSTR